MRVEGEEGGVVNTNNRCRRTIQAQESVSVIVHSSLMNVVTKSLRIVGKVSIYE